MTHLSQIVVQNLTYKTPTDKTIFTDLTLNIDKSKTAIIGKNGSGKTTLIKLICGELVPDSGSVKVCGTFAYDKYHNEDWNNQGRIRKELGRFGFANFDFNCDLSKLSGGEITRFYLAQAFATDADFLIFDEPTNNLDLTAKNFLYDRIKNCKQNIIVISHDRKLLELMQQIIEITPLGVKVYGGNYSFYLEQKAAEEAVKMRQLQDAKKFIYKTERSVQATREKHEQREAQGMRLRKSGSQATIILDGMKARAECTQKRLATREQLMLEKAQEKLVIAKANVAVGEVFKFTLPKTKVPNGKLVVSLEDVNFAYPDSGKLIIKDFNLIIAGPERVAIIGDNGSGKTTLIKLIQGELAPISGKIICGVIRISYLDQRASALDPKLSILDNFKIFNPQIKETEVHANLASFLFRNQDALKIVATLSSGEKLRALLACVLMAIEPPQLIILDEPTNYLDLDSIAAIESALNLYEGALLVISHDEVFLNNIGITRMISLPTMYTSPGSQIK